MTLPVSGHRQQLDVCREPRGWPLPTPLVPGSGQGCSMMRVSWSSKWTVPGLIPLSFEPGRKTLIRPKRVPAEKHRATRLVLDHLDEYPILTAASESEKIRRLERENRELGSERDREGRGSFFAGELHPRRRRSSDSSKDNELRASRSSRSVRFCGRRARRSRGGFRSVPVDVQ